VIYGSKAQCRSEEEDSMMTATAGPWTVGIQYDNADFETNLHGCPVFADTLEIAEARGESEQECSANARLIAAAPELLGELQSLTSLAEALNNRQHAGLEVTPAMWSELYSLTNSARTAIAKATEGRE